MRIRLHIKCKSIHPSSTYIRQLSSVSLKITLAKRKEFLEFEPEHFCQSKRTAVMLILKTFNKRKQKPHRGYNNGYLNVIFLAASFKYMWI